jgi:Pro-kumamolisin, activation domain/Bacterial Ig-like domain (group 3)
MESSFGLRLCSAVSCLLVSLSFAHAQTSLLTQSSTWDEKDLVTLHGTVHPMARPEYDQGKVGDDLSVPRMLLMLARPAGRQNDLDQFLRQVHDPGSSVYHHWVTPAEFGTRFGATDEDSEIVAEWLRSHGFAVARVTQGKSFIEFSGSAGQIAEALHTEIHRFSAHGKTFYANSKEIAVPAAIAFRIAAFAPLNNLPLSSYAKRVGTAAVSRSGVQSHAQFTLTENGQPFYALGPEDFATQYDVAPVYAAGLNGAGQTIGILGEYNLNLALVDAYRKLFNLPASNVQVIVDGQDPGDGSAPNVEGYLDVETSGAIAPAATINFYIAGAEATSTEVWNPLTLAALRAVEDNQASILSASFGECEQDLGESGNQVWQGLWEQAAAQGQTVFVSSGDSGPATCDVIGTTASGQLIMPSVSVNGLSSTPWNVSVGGTDFYYSDYASGAPSAASLWNQSNDTSNGSLKASLPEQPWDDALGFDVLADQGDAAGGGGVSNCSQETTQASGGQPACIAGYAKPLWQNAPGVPSDGARDLPDVSLFASNGANLSAAPICAEPGDCAAGGEQQLTLVGGTSVSTPSMAGVMALIDQKYGRQGQANYTLYALARQQPNVFHDITIGTNDITCPEILESPACDVAVANQPFVDSYGIYAAGPGYDLASGLGSIDVSQLLNNWNKVSYAASTTTLQVTPATVVHGSPVTASIVVKANSGTEVPTGNVALEASFGTTIPQNVPVALTNGAASANLASLPGGSYQLTAEYGGDGTFAASSSAPVSLTVTPENSTTSLTALPNSPIGQIAYGDAPVFTAVPSGVLSRTSGLATGNVTFTDGGTSATVPLDGLGVATWRPESFAMGTHTITAAYSGDASFAASVSTPLSLNVVKPTPLLYVVTDTQFSGCAQGLTSCGTGNGIVYQPGSNMVISVFMGGGDGTPPTGAVTVNFGSLSQTVALAPIANIAAGWATFNNVPSGSYALNAAYVGDGNWGPATYTASAPFVFGASNLPTTPATTTTTLTLSPGSVDSSGSVTFNVGVTASSSQNGCFLGTNAATLYASSVSFAFVPLTCNVVSGAVSITGSATVPATELPPGSYQVVAEYQGLPGIQESSFSNSVPLAVTVTDFSLAAMGKNFSMAAGGSLAIPVLLGGPSSSTIAVNLSCAVSSPSLTCTVSPTSASVTGSESATIAVNAFTTSAAATARHDPRRGSGFLLRSGEGIALGLFVFMALPNRRQATKLWVALAACVIAVGVAGCGASSSGSSSPAPGNSGPGSVPAPAGNYTVTVTGISGGISHSSTVYVQVQ